ncbi:MAG: tRNA (adenosine(37)-N6)-dimethylallyltransferase MiaA [Bacteroidia bacterium]|nr:tRNA (adenosine(37)-N6)-dimethylallyltransferase MiaA [Bacteroidia bacterium]
MQNHNCIVVLGATASGKTRLACDLAYVLDAEIISLDSRQVYKGLDIGTGKDLEAYTVQGKEIPYHLIDVFEPEQQFYLHDFIRELKLSFEQVLEKKKIPLLCGGTGLYLDALRKDFSFTQIPEDHKLRQELNQLSKEELLVQLNAMPESSSRHVDRNSQKRIIRGIEVARYLSKNQVEPDFPEDKYKPLYLGIRIDTYENRNNIRERLIQRLQSGMVDEAEGLLKNGVSHERLQELGLEYKYLSYYLQNKITKTELTEQLYTAICQYAKRQMTWFRKMEKEEVKIQWLEAPVCNADLIAQLKAQLLF